VRIPNDGVPSTKYDSSILNLQFKIKKIIKIFISRIARIFPGQILGPHENGINEKFDHCFPFGVLLN